MKKSHIAVLSTMLFAVIIYACQPESKDAGEGGWLKGSPDEKFNTLANQHGGFSHTMWEVGYRYNELYFAGQDQNWGFAAHQVEHIEEAIEAGLIRRPEHAESAASFLEYTLPAIDAAIEKKDTVEFAKTFSMLTTACNSCHIKQDHQYVNIVTPTSRMSPVGPMQITE
ncbi:hypothetical protein [Penaeicola halotolerans]|uniref:hypothetical protein n=1 Tax=Penaeicola halotolerans TaxID=2793196 RepID=UPI001CF872B5|nr:hypothetical protein [Penaeicola halotolerans]